MKEKKTAEELIAHMKDKGITFNAMSEEEAKNFLCQNNYYMKLAAYRANYEKTPDCSKQAGKYVNLDFSELRELSTIDMHLRYIVMQICLDLEHILKVKLLDHISSNDSEDGYSIVKEYIKAEDNDFRILKGIRSHKSGEYCKDLIDKHYPYFPIWVLVELISFGDLLHVCAFYERRYNCKILPDNKYVNVVRDFRNAAAHSNCLINKMTERMEDTKQPGVEITEFVKQMSGISSQLRTKYLHRNFPYNFVVLLYVYNELMPDVPRRKRFLELQEFMNGRVVKHKELFIKSLQLQGTYRFTKLVIDNLVSMSENDNTIENNA